MRKKVDVSSVAERVTNKEIALVEDHPTVHQDQEDQGQDLVHIQAEAQAVVEEEEMIEEITEEIGNIEIAEVIAEHQRALILEDTREAEAKNLREEEIGVKRQKEEWKQRQIAF